MKTIINIQLSQKELENDFLECLRNREIPSRFSYWGKKETFGWLKVCKSKDYGVYDKGVDLVTSNIPKISKCIQKSGHHEFNFISLGVGNGIKDSIIIEFFLQNFEMKYFPIDISLDMLNEGMENIRQNIKTVGFISDFRHFSDISELIRQNHYKNHLVSILGNTLGNFGQVEILNSLRRGMTKDDFLLIEVTLRKDAGSKIHGENLTDIIESYNNEDYKSFVFTPLIKAGFSLEDGIIEVEYGPNQYYPKLSSIEIWFRIGKDKTVNYADQELVFKKDERIMLYVSHKYNQENIHALLDGNGFKVCDCYISKDGLSGMFLSNLK